VTPEAKIGLASERFDRMVAAGFLKPAEVAELVDLALTARLSTAQGPVAFCDSIFSMVQSIERLGAEQRDKLLEIARRSPVERDAEFDLFDASKKLRDAARADVARGRPEGAAKRELREQLVALLHRAYPTATPDALWLTVGQCFEDVPGGWHFNVARAVLALRNPTRI